MDIQTDGDYIKRVIHGPPGDHTLKNTTLTGDENKMLRIFRVASHERKMFFNLCCDVALGRVTDDTLVVLPCVPARENKPHSLTNTTPSSSCSANDKNFHN